MQHVREMPRKTPEFTFKRTHKLSPDVPVLYLKVCEQIKGCAVGFLLTSQSCERAEIYEHQSEDKSLFFERCLLQIPCDPDAEVFVSPLRVTANVISELWPQADGRSTLSSRTQTELRACRLTGPRTAAGTPTSHTHTLRYTHLYQEQNSLFSVLVLFNPVY